MKLLTVLLSVIGIAAAVPAFADANYQSAGATGNDTAVGGVADGTYSSGARGKTRAEVHAELIQAQKDGLLPFRRNDYPPGAETIRRNQELYRLSH